MQVKDDWFSRFRMRVRHCVLAARFFAVERTRPLVARVRRLVPTIRRSLIIVVGLGIGLVLYRFEGPHITPEALRDYLVAAGAMIGGATAIILSLSLFLTQGVASLYADQHFDTYAGHWRDQTTFALIIAITLGLFGGALYVAGLSQDAAMGIAPLVILLSLVLIALAFFLIDLQYEHVRERINPSTVIAYLRSQGQRSVRTMRRDAERAADVIDFNASGADRSLAVAAAYNRLYQPSIASLERQIMALIELSRKLADRGEDRAALLGLEASSFLLSEYFAARSGSSILVRTTENFMVAQSDSSAFIGRVLERLNEAGRAFIRDNRPELSQYLVTVYSNLCSSALNVQYVPDQNENPILEQVLGYLWQFVRDAAAARDIEVPFRSQQVMGDLAAPVAAKGYEVVLAALQERFIGIAHLGFGMRESVTANEAVNAYFKTIGAIFASDKLQRDIPLRTAIDTLATITAETSALVASGILPNDWASRQAIEKAYWELPNTIVPVINNYGSVDSSKAPTYRSDLKKLFEDITSSLRHLSEAIKSADSLLISGVAYTLKQTTEFLITLLVDADFSEPRLRLRERLIALIYSPYWFARYAESFNSSDNAFQELCDVVACDGILAASHLTDMEAVNDCIKSLSDIAKQASEKGTNSPYYEARVMLRACMLGIIALKFEWSDTLSLLRTKLAEFDAAFLQKYAASMPQSSGFAGPPYPDQVRHEVERWQREFEQDAMNGLLGLKNDASEMMHAVVDSGDIARFIETFWPSSPPSVTAE